MDKWWTHGKYDNTLGSSSRSNSFLIIRYSIPFDSLKLVDGHSNEIFPLKDNWQDFNTGKRTSGEKENSSITVWSDWWMINDDNFGKDIRRRRESDEITLSKTSVSTWTNSSAFLTDENITLNINELNKWIEQNLYNTVENWLLIKMTC